MHIATHNVEVPFPQAFASLARSLFPCAPGYSRNRVPPVGRDLLAVRRECALLRDSTLASFPVSWQTRSCFYLPPCAVEPTETRLGCQGAMNMIAYNHENVKNNFSIIRTRQASHTGYPRVLWGTFRCRSHPHCLARDMASYQTGASPTQAPHKEWRFIPHLKDGGFPARWSVTNIMCISYRKRKGMG